MHNNKPQANTFSLSETTKHSNKMVSPRNMLLLLLGVMAISITIYFAQRYYFHEGKNGEVVNPIADATQSTLLDEGEKTGESGENTTPVSIDGAHGQIEGSLYLKSIFKNMTCESVGDDENTLSLSCCGDFLLPNSDEERKGRGCLKVDAQKVFDSIDYLFRVRFYVNGEIRASEQSIGLFPPTNTCFEINEGNKLCVDFTLMLFDNGEANESAFNSCALIIISSKSRKSWETAPEVKDMKSDISYLSCNTEKAQVLEKSTSKFATIIRIYLSTIEEVPVTQPEAERNSEMQGSLYIKSIMEEMICNIQQTSSLYEMSCCGHFSIPHSSQVPKGCAIIEAKTDPKQELDYTSGIKLEVDDDQIGFINTQGLLRPGVKCFEIGEFPENQMCVDITLMSLETKSIDESVFKTCTMVAFSSKNHTSWEAIPKLDDIVGTPIAIPCNASEDDVLLKTEGKPLAVARIFMKTNLLKDKKQGVNEITSSEIQHPPYGGAVYMKSVIQEMKCELTYTGSTDDLYALSCHGRIPLGDDKIHSGTFLVRSSRGTAENPSTGDVKIGLENEYTYNVTLTIDNKQIASYTISGFPGPGKDCHQIPGFPNLKECIALEEMTVDENLSNETHYHTCKLMVFNSHKEKSKYGSFHISAAIRRLEDLPCDTPKQVLLEKGGQSSDVLRISVEEATEKDKKEWETSNSAKEDHNEPKSLEKDAASTRDNQGIFELFNSSLMKLFS